MIRVYLIQDNKQVDISSFCANITLSDNIDSLGRELKLDYLNNYVYDSYTQFTALRTGNTIILYDNEEQLFAGQIITLSRSGVSNYSVTMYDNAFYLNKNEAQIQFTDLDVKSCIEQLCSQEYIPCKVDCDIPTKVTKIYNGETISNIIDDLLKQATDDTGLKYRREYNQGCLYVNAMNNLKMVWESKPLVSEFSYDESIDNLANRVVVVSSSEKNKTVFAEAKNEESIKLYGQYTHYEKVDDKKQAKAQDIANKKLKELSRTFEKATVTLLGDNYIRSGRIIQFEQPEIGLYGEYLVEHCTHNYNGALHTMECEVVKNDEGQ